MVTCRWPYTHTWRCISAAHLKYSHPVRGNWVSTHALFRCSKCGVTRVQEFEHFKLTPEEINSE